MDLGKYSYIFVEIVALLLSIFCWREIRHSNFKTFPAFLFFIVLVEVLGWYTFYYLGKENAWLYNISVPIEYLFYCGLFYLSYDRLLYKRIAILFASTFLCYVLIFSFKVGIRNFNFNYLLVGSLAMMIFSCLYFLNEYSKQTAENIWTQPMFWVAFGILLFNSGEFFYNFLVKFIAKNDLDPTIALFKTINNNLIVPFYLFIIAGLLCQTIMKRLKKG